MALSNLQKWPSKGSHEKVLFHPKITPPLLCSFGKTTLTHSFIVVPQCPMALMGCDLLAKLQTSINLPFLDPISILCIQMAPEPMAGPHSQNLLPDLPPIDPRVWDTKTPSVAWHHSPIQVFLKNPSQVITQTQYTLTKESRKGLKPIISRLLKAGLLQPICSPHNTSILAVKTEPHSWRLVQDLCKINEAIIPVHPVVTNPYTFLSHSPPDILYFTVLDLKDALITIPLHHSSRPLFAFTWTDPDTYQSQQLTWTVLPQGFRDSPHFFLSSPPKRPTDFRPRLYYFTPICRRFM